MYIQLANDVFARKRSKHNSFERERTGDNSKNNPEFPVTWVYFHREPELGRINGRMVESVNKTTTVAVYCKLR